MVNWEVSSLSWECEYDEDAQQSHCFEVFIFFNFDKDIIYSIILVISSLCFYYESRPGARQHDVIFKSWYHSLLYFWSSAPELRSGYTASCSHVSQESDQHNPFVEDWHALVVRQCARILMLIMHSSPPSLQKAWHVLLLWFAPWPLPALSHNCATTNPCNLCSTLFCRHKWAGLGLTHLANRKRCWLVPLFFAKDPSRIVDIEWLWFMLFSKYKTAKDCPRTGQEQAYTGIT